MYCNLLWQSNLLAFISYVLSRLTKMMLNPRYVTKKISWLIGYYLLFGISWIFLHLWHLMWSTLKYCPSLKYIWLDIYILFQNVWMKVIGVYRVNKIYKYELYYIPITNENIKTKIYDAFKRCDTVGVGVRMICIMKNNFLGATYYNPRKRNIIITILYENHSGI